MSVSSSPSSKLRAAEPLDFSSSCTSRGRSCFASSYPACASAAISFRRHTICCGFVKRRGIQQQREPLAIVARRLQRGVALQGPPTLARRSRTRGTVMGSF